MCIAPDGELVEVLFIIHDAYRKTVHRNTAVQLQPFGDTGLFTLELKQIQPDEMDKRPEIGFPSEYAVIPSIPSTNPKGTLLLSIHKKLEKMLEYMMELSESSGSAPEISTGYIVPSGATLTATQE